MIAQYFDCTLNAGYPTVRIPVNVPSCAQEVLDDLSDAKLNMLAEQAKQPNLSPEQKLELVHERLRVDVLRRIYRQDEAKWLRDNGQRLLAQPGSEPKDFASAFLKLFEPSNFADRFARDDARAEYFRLYAIKRSHATFMCVEVDPASPEPPREHENWTEIRKQERVATHGTERPRKQAVAIQEAKKAVATS